MMVGASQGNSKRAAGWDILLFLLILSLATLHGGCAGVTSSSNPGAPTVSITSPTSSATVSVSTTVSANASANTVGVQFKLDGANLGSEKTSAPFSTSWDTTTTANGQHTLMAAARNAANQTGNSAPVTVTVQNSSGGPTVSITSPTSGATVSASATVSANVSANTVGVQFKLDGSNLGSEVTAAPFSVSWDTTTTANGQHALTAVARNAGGQTATSAAVGVTVQNSSGGGGAPVISGVGADRGSTSAVIFWTTDVPSDSQVDYGISPSYGQTSALDSAAVTTHSVAIGGLTASTLYHYRVKSKDAGGHLATSADFTFSTLAPGAQNSLAALAASMAPGTWARLNTVGLVQTLEPPEGGSVLEYDDRLVWDPVRRRVYVLGGSHGTLVVDWALHDRFGYYDDATNTWINLPQTCQRADPTNGDACSFPLPQFRASHGYEHLTVDLNGNLYYRLYGTLQIMKWTASGQTWSALPVPTTFDGIQVAGALAFFPERNSIIFLNGGCCVDAGVVTGELYEFNLTAQTWARIGPHEPMGWYQDFAAYSPTSKAVIFGGGSPGTNTNSTYMLDAVGNITTLALPPADPNLPILGINNTLNTVDPVSGNLLFWDAVGHEWELNPSTNAWRQINIAPPPVLLPNPGFGSVLNVAAASIPTYGVVMVIAYNSTSSVVYLYKHVAQ